MNDARGVPGTLVLLLIAAAVLLLVAPRPPPPPAETPEQSAAAARAAEIAFQSARAWHDEHGDHVIPWDDAAGHLAIVIDDVGRDLYHFERLHELRWRLSYSVLPGSIYAPGVQLRLLEDHRRPREILLHLPMQPDDDAKMHEGAEVQENFLRVDDDAATLREKTRAAIARVPAATIVNNHMGSRLTRDRAAMDAVMAELAAHGLAFVDSRTTGDSVAQAAASAAGIVNAQREVFLDHDPSPAAIEAALDRAAALSRDHPVVAIAHPSDAVLDVLRRRLPRLHEQGIAIVSVGRILATRRDVADHEPGPPLPPSG